MPVGVNASQGGATISGLLGLMGLRACPARVALRNHLSENLFVPGGTNSLCFSKM
jgi:hypothetical protein